MEYKTLDIWGQTHTYSDTDDIAWDGMNLLSGAATIFLPQSEIDKSPFESGETANVYYTTGFTGGLGWTIWARPPRDRTDISQEVITLKTGIPDNRESFLGVTIGADWYKAGSLNGWSIELMNPYFPRAETTILAIDDRERAPIVTDISGVNNGDSFSYTVTVEETYAALNFISVDAWYSYSEGTSKPGSTDTESWIMDDVSYPISGGVATFTVYPKSNIQGLIVVEVVAYDIDTRPSAPSYESFVVNNNGTKPGGDPVEQPFVWTTSAVITAALLVLGIVAIMWFAPIPMNMKIILVMILGIAGAILVWLFGTLQIGG